MLEALRKQSQNTLIWGAFGVIIFVFIFFFGPQTSGFAPGSRTWAVRVEGHTIYDTQLVRAYERLRDARRDLRRLDDAEFVQLQQQIALDMALVHVLAARAEEAGLAITENEVSCYIVNWHPGYVIDGEPICQQYPENYRAVYRNEHFPYYADGEVLAARYRQAIRSMFAMSIDEYEAYKGRELLALKYLELVGASLGVPRDVVEATYRRRTESVDLEYIRLDPARASVAPVSDADVASWAAANSDAIQSYYDDNVDEFSEPEQVRVRRIHRRKPRDGSIDEARAEYEGILARAQSGDEDFEALVREFTQFESERDNGGDMGMLPRSDISAELWDLAQEMEIGEVRGLERDAFWNVVKLEDKQPARVRPLDEVRLEIARQLLQEERREEAIASVAQRGERILALAAEGATLEEAAQREADEATEALRASMPAPTDDVPDDGDADEDGAEGEDDGEETDEDEAAAEDDETDALPGVEPFLVSSTGAFARERAGGVIEFNGQSLRTNGQPADDVPGIGTSTALARLAFELSEDAPLHPELVRVGDVDYIVRLNERQAVPDELPEDELATIADELRDELASQLVDPVGARIRLTLHLGAGPYAPVVEDILQGAVDDGTIKLNGSFFRYDPVEELAEEE